nr:MAG TPA: hypothetical protein [Crassvirales sp.]
MIFQNNLRYIRREPNFIYTLSLFNNYKPKSTFSQSSM